MKATNRKYGFVSVKLLAAACLLVSGFAVNAQSVAVSETNAAADPSAMLDVQSVTKGMLIPRMTESQRNAIASPADGLIVYQTANTGTSRRGFWYYDDSNSQWLHLGRGEYSGVVDQATSTVVSSSHTSNATSIDVGQTELGWFIPSITTPPSVVVIPEYTVIGTPPDISSYCQPSSGSCTPSLGRMNWIRIYYPDPLFTGFTTVSPPLAAIMGHPNCSGPNNFYYKHVPQDGGSYSSQYADFNNFVVDFCSGTGDIAFAMRAANSNPKSFSFWADLNQDGDFQDAGELLDTRPFLTPNNGFTDFLFGTGQPSYFPPITIPASVVNGVTKLRVMIRGTQPPQTNPCFPGDIYTKVYDFDMEVVCGGGGTPFYPSELNWCNVDDITNNSARVSCFDQDGTPADLKFHYKIIRHD